MASEALNKYIEKRYDRWLDYAKYHCSLAGMTDEAIDVLNEVMCMLLQKPLEHLSRLMEAKQGKYTELDFYILQMIKLNVTSDTSPYRHKYKPIKLIRKSQTDLCLEILCRRVFRGLAGTGKQEGVV